MVAADPEAVVMIGTQDAVADTIKLVRRDMDPVFMTISFAGGAALADALGEDGHGVYVTQVAPFPEDTSLPLVARYQAALAGLRSRGGARVCVPGGIPGRPAGDIRAGGLRGGS